MKEIARGIYEYALARGLPRSKANRDTAKEIAEAIEAADGIEHPATTVECFLRAKGLNVNAEIRREARTIARFYNKYRGNY